MTYQIKQADKGYQIIRDGKPINSGQVYTEKEARALADRLEKMYRGEK